MVTDPKITRLYISVEYESEASLSHDLINAGVLAQLSKTRSIYINNDRGSAVSSVGDVQIREVQFAHPLSNRNPHANPDRL